MESATGKDSPDPETVENDQSNKDLPAVFQCQHCNVIISDSIAFIAAHDDLKSITLNSVNASVELSTKLITSTDGIDQGSTFSPLVCRGCKTVLGKVYRTTPRPLDDLRDYFTIDVNKLSVYQVGSTDSSSLPESDTPFQQFTNVKALKETTLKLQVLMCAMHQRIQNIEQSLEIEDTNPSENPLQSMSGILENNPGLLSTKYPHQPKEGLQSGSAKNLASRKNEGRNPALGPGSERGQGLGKYLGKDVQRNGVFEKANGSQQTLTDSDTSRASMDDYSGSKRSKRSSSKTSRAATKGQDSRVRGTKRTKDYNEVSGSQGDFQNELELLSPIRKISGGRLNKPL
ncbi:uncharacterized protein LOC121413876 [Lytechinus variegatus]|uniref:uncharacterized protein LOC121413876 n=1 Tax=Lytechinus variegatus TaxID=7654 RepID=UPI001BB1CC09|nr:uncharacterized protein LOC121413876 [Lytechinus variegatus]